MFAVTSMKKARLKECSSLKPVFFFTLLGTPTVETRQQVLDAGEFFAVPVLFAFKIVDRLVVTFLAHQKQRRTCGQYNTLYYSAAKSRYHNTNVRSAPKG